MTTTELRALRRWQRSPEELLPFKDQRLDRFKKPIIDCCGRIGINRQKRFALVRYMFHHMAVLARSYWEWNADEWVSLVEQTVPPHCRSGFRPHVVLLALHLGEFNLTAEIMPSRCKSTRFASMLWGTIVDDSISLVRGYLVSIGYRVEETRPAGRLLQQTLIAAMLALKEPDVRCWDEREYYALVRGEGAPVSISLNGKRRNYALSIALALQRLGIFAIDPQVHTHGNAPSEAVPTGYTSEWDGWVERFVKHSVSAKATTKQLRYFLHFVGRWAVTHHPEASNSPADWDVEIAADFAAFVANGKVGDLQDETALRHVRSVGSPLSPNTKAGRISMIRVFFDTLIESGLIRRRFATRIVFRLPDEIAREAAPKPRDLEDDVWAKLLWAGLNLEEPDLGLVLRSRYPIEMLQAIVVVWLFAGLRSSELRRLEKDCVRWEYSLLERDVEGVQPSICYLTVPTNKYKPEFRKPVAGEVGKAIEAWRAIRPEQPGVIDPKTLRCEDKLFCVRGRLIGQRLIRSLIHWVCAKAGVPAHDRKGQFTVHRARSTIATQLANAKEPMSPWELKEWLGHGSIRSTEWYVNQRPLTLAKKYAAADSWRRNLARVKVILDAEVIESGAAAQGAIYRAYDLGHGYCTDRFFSRCPHRMACARCGYYVPKESTKGELLSAIGANEQLYEEIPIRDEERLALEGDAEAVRELVKGLEIVPAPDGRMPREIQAQSGPHA